MPPSSRPRSAVAAVVLLLCATPASAQERKAVPIALPDEACLAAPGIPCLTEAAARAIANLERDEFRLTVGARFIVPLATGDVDDPALTALALQLDPRLTPERIVQMRENWRKSTVAAVAPSPDPLPGDAEIGAASAQALAIADAGDRVRAVIRLAERLARHRQYETIAALAKPAFATLRGDRPETARLRHYLGSTLARHFRDGGDWERWSQMLLAGGWGALVARAKPDGDPEQDPTDTVFAEPLEAGARQELMFAWALRAQNPAYRARILNLIGNEARERGRIAVWRADFPAFRHRIVAATAKGVALDDAGLLRFAQNEAQARRDAGLALALKLQPLLQPLFAHAGPADRDHHRGFVLQALAEAIRALARETR